jgi:hypothetical protein
MYERSKDLYFGHPLFSDIPPSITEGPANQTYKLLYGESKSFNCAASGIPEPSAVWYKDDKIVVNATGVSVTEDMSLTLREVTAERNGVYKCVAKNLGGTVSSNAIVSVYCKMCLLPPSIVHRFSAFSLLHFFLKPGCSFS